MLQYDDDEDIAEEAQQQWEEKNLSLSPVFYIPLFQLLGHSVDKIRNAASSAIAHVPKEYCKCTNSSGEEM